jgi:hypothetical protein
MKNLLYSLELRSFRVGPKEVETLNLGFTEFLICLRKQSQSLISKSGGSGFGINAH